METFQDSRIRSSYWALRLTFGLVPFLAGLDKFTNLLTFWPHYLSPTLTRLLPVSAGAFMHVVGVIEMVAGILVLSKLTRIGAYVVMGWLVCIAINLVSLGMFDIAVRDLALAAGAFSLAGLEAVRIGANARHAVGARTATATV